MIQEDVERDGEAIVVRDGRDAADHVRPAGGDFRAGARLDGAAPARPGGHRAGGGDERGLGRR